jgi:hypothetical protein
MKLTLTSAMKRLSAVMLFCAIGPVVGFSSASAASATASGPSALALAAVVASHESLLGSFERGVAPVRQQDPHPSADL